MTARRGISGRGSILAGFGALLATALPAVAETSIEASYAATLGGFPIGSGKLSFGVGDNGDYRAAVDARVSGLATLIANRTASASASGRVSGNDVASRGYRLAIDGGSMPNHVDMNFSGGAVTQAEVSELRFPGWDRRIPLKPEHKRGVIDPLAAFVVAVPPGKDAMAPANCNHTARVFDGRVRYDLRMTYGTRMEVQGTGNGYSGPALVCAVAYRPIAGYRPLSPEEERFERNLEFSIWFVPASANVMIPYKVVVGTPVGLLQVYAHRFEVRSTRSADAAEPEPATTATVRGKRRAALQDEPAAEAR